MKIAIIGTGYVGLVTGTCLAESGQAVFGADIDAGKVTKLQRGQPPIYEPGLAELLARNLRAGRLHFTTRLPDAVRGAACVFIAVGTPQTEDGTPDLSHLWSVADSLADCLEDGQIVVVKSTVPVGTNALLTERLACLTQARISVAANPEFLKEGAAIQDFLKPDRVIVGTYDREVAGLLHTLYVPFLGAQRPFLVMSPESAELAKYAANALLATKISFINEIANLCEQVGADIDEVRRGIGHDPRIGFAFLRPGVGYGGSCFPKDVRALIAAYRAHGAEPHLLQAVDRVNEAQKGVLFRKIRDHFHGRLEGRTLAIWGLAFKPETDDIREAPALALIDELLAHGVQVRAHDPIALNNVRTRYGDRLIYCDQRDDALQEADGLAIVTEWEEFRHPDFALMHRRLRHPVIFDGRHLYDEAQLAADGFTYYFIGRPAERERSAWHRLVA